MKLKSTVVAGLLTASMAVPVFANEAVVKPLPQFTAQDTQMLFEQDAKPMQLAALSQQEMKETEGALFVVVVISPAWYALVPAASTAMGFAVKAGTTYGTRPTFGEMYGVARGWFR